MERRQEIEIDRLAAAKKAFNIRVIKRLDADDVRSGRQPGDLKLAVAIEREASDERPGPGIERHHVGAEHAGAVLEHLSSYHAGLLPEGSIRIEIRRARDVVGLQLTIERYAAAERNRKHDGA